MSSSTIRHPPSRQSLLEARSLLALAELNLLTGNKEKCRKYAKEAKEKFDKSAKYELLRADDLIELGGEEKSS